MLKRTPYTDAFRVILQECGGATINYRVAAYQTTSAGPAYLKEVGHLEDEPCSATPVPTTSSSSRTTAPPTDEEEPQSWGECMMDAGRLAVNAGEWVGSKASELQLALLAPPVRQIATLSRLATATELATAGAATGEAAAAGSVVAPALGVVAAGVLLGVAGSCALNPNAFGDPHLVTLDGRSYDLQSVGEFHLLEVPDAGFDVQALFVPAGGTVRSSSVALTSGVTVELRPTAPCSSRVTRTRSRATGS